jgi:hypothetical protein
MKVLMFLAICYMAAAFVLACPFWPDRVSEFGWRMAALGMLAAIGIGLPVGAWGLLFGGWSIL